MKVWQFLLWIPIALIFAFFVGGYCIEYSVEFWGVYFMHHAVDVPFLPCGIAGIFLSEIAVPVALITWIISFVI